MLNIKKIIRSKLKIDYIQHGIILNHWFVGIIGPSSKCFCDHPYKLHDYLNSTNGKVKCKNPGCKCINYSYIPIHGSQDFKCACKHSYQVHDLVKKTCNSCACKGFTSSWSCTCGFKFN